MVVRCHSAATYSMTWHIHSGSKDNVKYKNWWLRFVVLVLYPKSTPWTSFSTIYSDDVIAGKPFRYQSDVVSTSFSPPWLMLWCACDAVLCAVQLPASPFLCSGWDWRRPGQHQHWQGDCFLPLTSCCKRLHSSSLHPLQAQYIKLASYLEVVCVCKWSPHYWT